MEKLVTWTETITYQQIVALDDDFDTDDDREDGFSRIVNAITSQEPNYREMHVEERDILEVADPPEESVRGRP